MSRSAKPTQGALGAQASASATATGPLWPVTQSQIVCVVGSLILVGFGLWGGSELVIGVGLVCFVATIANAVVRSWARQEAPGPSVVAVTDDGLSVTTFQPNLDLMDLAWRLRREAQGRKELPVPDGEVTGDPQDPKNVREYTADEKVSVAQDTANQVAEFDEQQLKEVAKQQVKRKQQRRAPVGDPIDVRPVEGRQVTGTGNPTSR